MASSPEILFFILMISATAWGDLNETTKPIARDFILGFIKTSLFIGTVVPAFFYGGFIITLLYDDSPLGIELSTFRTKLFPLSIAAALIFLIVSTAVQVMIGKIENG